jgi:beta-lactam-binding protein with PASTA domain
VTKPTAAPTQSTAAPSVTASPTQAAPTQVAVPAGLVGMLRADAEAAVLGAGLNPVTTEKLSPGVPPGTVVSAAPASGTLPPGGTVTLVVSKDPVAAVTPPPATAPPG